MKASLLVVGVVAAILFVGLGRMFARDRTALRFLQLLGAGFLVIVFLAHIAEAYDLFPAMKWGHPDSVGHYLDLVSAIAGSTLLLLGLLLQFIDRRKRSTPA